MAKSVKKKRSGKNTGKPHKSGKLSQANKDLACQILADMEQKGLLPDAPFVEIQLRDEQVIVKIERKD